MTKRTVDLIIRVAIEVVDWLNIILKEKKETKNNDSKSKKERESGKTTGHPGQ